MLKISVWDEIGAEWAVRELDLPPDCRDPKAINRALEVANFDVGEPLGDDDEPGWEVHGQSQTNATMTIEARSDRGHLCIIVVNYEDQEPG